MAYLLIHDSCTTISAIKLWDFQRIQDLKEVYYESVTLSIWSMTEVSVGIVVANLPPLRKFFDRFLNHIVSGSFTSKVDFPSLHLSTYRSKNDRKSMTDGMACRSARLHSSATGDNESDRAALNKVELDDRKHSNEIVKTTQVTLDCGALK
jgi:hypothetical protein